MTNWLFRTQTRKTGNQTILVQDLDAQNQVVAESAVTIESGTKGALEVSGIPREFTVGDDVSDDLPTWVITNGWHQFLYVAYGDAFRPDAVFPYVANSDGTCPAQSPCLTVYRGRTTAPQSSADTARSDGDCAVVVGAGVAVEVDGVAQVDLRLTSRTILKAKMRSDCWSSARGVGDLEFEFEPTLLLPTFNDAIKLLRVQ